MQLKALPPDPSKDQAYFKAVIFDMDGVVTNTAMLHSAAWKTLFDHVLSLQVPAQPPFNIDRDYRRYVDGRPREDGIRTFLASRGLSVPEGTSHDSPEELSVQGMAIRKQHLFDHELRRGGAEVFPDALQLLERLQLEGTPTALVTSSRNSRAVLESAGITHLFAVRVDGSDALRLGLPGKPAASMFLHAAQRLGVAPAVAAVVEDAQAGIEAAIAGGFGLVVGVAREHDEGALLRAGAHEVVTDLSTLSLSKRKVWEGRPGTWCGGAADSGDGWLLRYEGFDPTHEGTREALCALGNGYWVTRGTFPGSTADGLHYPGTYFAGVYNRVTVAHEGRESESEHLVNAPDWTFLQIDTGDGVLHPQAPSLIHYDQQLDLRRGILTRRARFRSPAGRITRVTTQQIQSVAQPHLAALRMTVEAENWNGDIHVQSAINGQVNNSNTDADGAPTEHLTLVGSTYLDDETVLLETRTNQSEVTIAIAVRTRLSAAMPEPGSRTRLEDTGPHVGHNMTVRLQQGTPLTIEKIAAVATSRDRALSTAGSEAGKRILRAATFNVLRREHVAHWEELWERFGIDLQAGHRQSLALNMHIFHVLQTVTAASPDLDAGVPARGLHGEGYRGHIFWDELFVYPLLTLRRPALTRALLMYRYRRLDEARAAAHAAGMRGSLFPWQSGSDGREETPTELFNIRNQQWMPDNSRRQFHVGLGVAYSMWQYYQSTGDLEFLTTVGAEVIIEVARLFASIAIHDPEDNRFSICGVMGPDEYHDGYPDAPGQGLRNNTYTNVIAAWVLSRAVDVVALLAEHDLATLGNRLGLTDDEPLLWDYVSKKLTVAFHADGVVSQFEGYEGLREFDWDGHRKRYGNIGRLDLILQSEGDSTNNYRLSKQADVLMLFYLFSAEELRGVFHRMGYALPPDTIRRTVQFYLPRTSHGSTLSRLVHSWVLARSDRPQSWPLFAQALESDLSDSQGGTTREGIHLGAMAGTADMVMRCYGGIETRNGMLRIHPVLPQELPGTSFQIRYRDQPIDVKITQTHVRLHLHKCSAEPVLVCVEDAKRLLHPGEKWEVPLRRSGSDDTPSKPLVEPHEALTGTSSHEHHATENKNGRP